MLVYSKIMRDLVSGNLLQKGAHSHQQEYKIITARIYHLSSYMQTAHITHHRHNRFNCFGAWFCAENGICEQSKRIKEMNCTKANIQAAINGCIMPSEPKEIKNQGNNTNTFVLFIQIIFALWADCWCYINSCDIHNEQNKKERHVQDERSFNTGFYAEAANFNCFLFKHKTWVPALWNNRRHLALNICILWHSPKAVLLL